jgi:hypothetical protein
MDNKKLIEQKISELVNLYTNLQDKPLSSFTSKMVVMNEQIAKNSELIAQLKSDVEQLKDAVKLINARVNAPMVVPHKTIGEVVESKIKESTGTAANLLSSCLDKIIDCCDTCYNIVKPHMTIEITPTKTIAGVASSTFR